MLASTAGSAGAQQDVLPDTGGRVYGLIGGGFGDSKFVATGAGAGLRLTPHLGLDLELTHLSGSDRIEEVAATDSFPGISVFSTTNAIDGCHPRSNAIRPRVSAQFLRSSACDARPDATPLSIYVYR